MGIVSNNANAKVHEVSLRERRILLRKAKIPVTKENYRILQFLDFLKDTDQYVDENNCIRKYIVDEKIRKLDIDFILGNNPIEFSDIYNGVV